MINLMYLVLTAMLALNVSAEVMNAFFTLDKGNKASINTVETQLDQTVDGLKELLKDESKAKYQPIEPAIDEVRSAVADFNIYVDQMRDMLIDASGNKNGEVDEGDYIIDHGKEVPKGKKNKDVTTRMLVDEGKGDELKEKILETRQRLIESYTSLLQEHGQDFGLSEQEIERNVQTIGDNIPFNVDDETWQETDKTSWADFKFRQMPLAAVLPLMSQMQSDAKSSEASLVNQMATLAGGRVVEFDAFFPVVQAEKAYVITGEPFRAEISVGTYSTQINPDDINISVNGNRLSVGEDGRAQYTASTGTTGQKTLNMQVSVRNPLTGEVTEGDGTFTYEVGRRSVTVSADKMNVMYIGVPNPISVVAAGISSNDLRVSGSGGGINLTRTGTGKYTATVSEQGTANVTVSGGGLSPTSFEFRVKRIPDPVAKLGGESSGDIGNGTFKAQRGVIAELQNFDFDARCEIVGFELVHAPPRKDPVPVSNPGATFNQATRNLVNQAAPGHRYYFNNVRAKCPGDKVSRKINPMVFQIR
jgi:gliding motility-associated protein GldM